MSKVFWSILAAAVLTVSLCGCSGKSASEDPKNVGPATGKNGNQTSGVTAGRVPGDKLQYGSKLNEKK